jgi:hypothetical protein
MKSGARYRWWLAATACCAVVGPNAPALSDDAQFETSARFGVWTSDRTIDDPSTAFSAQGWGRVRGKLDENLKVVGEARVEARVTGGKEPELKAEVREGYVQIAADHIVMRIGRQITDWGRADRIHPTDAAGSRDYTALVPTDEEQKRGQGTVRLDVDLGFATAQGYWIPEFREDKFGVFAVEGLRTRHDGWADQFAARLERAGGDFDWSVTYFTGLSHAPQVIKGAAPGVYLREYVQRQMLGADFATAVDGFTLRAEVARNWYDTGGRATVSGGPEWFAVAGVDHEFGAEFYGNMQLIYARSPDRAACGGVCNPELEYLANTNNVLAFTTADEELGVSALLAWHDEYETRRFEVSSVYLTRDEGLLLRARATFRLTDEFRVEVGGDYYTGGGNSVFGAQEDRGGGFVQAAWGF